jgi:hypothetical protein
MTLEALHARRQKLVEEFQRAMDQRERLRGALEEAGTAVERIRGAIALCDELLAGEQAPVPAPVAGNGLDTQPPIDVTP